VPFRRLSGILKNGLMRGQTSYNDKKSGLVADDIIDESGLNKGVDYVSTNESFADLYYVQNDVKGIPIH